MPEETNTESGQVPVDPIPQVSQTEVETQPEVQIPTPDPDDSQPAPVMFFKGSQVPTESSELESSETESK